MTITVCVQLELLPLQSVAVQVLVCVPVPGQVPGVKASRKVTTGLGSHASDAVGAGNTGVAGHWIGEVVAGHVIVGGVVSITFTVWLQLALLPHASVAFQVLVRLYVPAQAPGVVTSEISETTGAGSQTSVAVGTVKIGVAGHWIVAPVAQVSVGGVVSSVQVAVRETATAALSQASVAFQVLV